LPRFAGGTRSRARRSHKTRVHQQLFRPEELYRDFHPSFIAGFVFVGLASLYAEEIGGDDLQTSVNIQSINVAKSSVYSGPAFTKACQRSFEGAGVGTLKFQGETKKKIAGCAQVFAHFKNSDTGEQFNFLGN